MNTRYCFNKILTSTGGIMMERQIVGVLIEATDEGMITSMVSSFPILKETEKMVYPDRKNGGDSQVIRYLSNMRKAELGWVDENRYAHSFSYRAHDIIDSQEGLQELIDKVKSRARKELDSRIEIIEKWKQNYQELE